MTEKDYNPEQKNAKTMQKQQKASKKAEAPMTKSEVKEEKKEEVKIETEKSEEKKETKKKIEVKKVKKDNAVVKGISLPMSTKVSVAICKFVKKKSIETAMKDLEEVTKLRKAVPMKGEIPHRKGNIMSGRYPIKASEEFIKLLKTLQGNANVNGLDSPVIVEAYANLASRPYGRFGRTRKKRSHITLVVKEQKMKEKKLEAKN